MLSIDCGAVCSCSTNRQTPHQLDTVHAHTCNYVSSVQTPAALGEEAFTFEQEIHY